MIVKWGCTPFLTAIEFGSDNAIDLLLSEGCCDIFAKTKRGECALDMAVLGGRLDLFRRFVAFGIKACELSLASGCEFESITINLFEFRKVGDF